MDDTESTVSWALAVNATVTALKVGVGVACGSPSVLAEAAHSAVDCSTQLLLVAGTRHERRSPGIVYRYGLAAGVVMLVSGGLYGLESGLTALVSGSQDSGGSWWLALAVLAASSALEATSLCRAVRTLARTRNGRGWLVHLRTTTDTASKTVVVEDGSDILGNAIAAAAVALTALTGSPVWDAVGAIAVGLLLTALSTELIGHNVRCARTV